MPQVYKAKIPVDGLQRPAFQHHVLGVPGPAHFSDARDTVLSSAVSKIPFYFISLLLSTLSSFSNTPSA
jgi:hypothetical protein